MAEKKQLPRVERVEGEERKKALSAALAQIEKQFGKNYSKENIFKRIV